MSKLAYILLLALLVYLSVMALFIKYMSEPEPPEPYYDYSIYHKIEVSNPDSTMMMCYVRNTKGSRDTLFRLRNKL